MSRSKSDLMNNRSTLTHSAGRVALFGTSEDHEYLVLDIEQVHPNPNQPRRHFDEVKLQELAASIAERGVLQPILVRETARDRFEIIAGERRWRASKLAGKTQIPSLAIRTNDTALLSVLENLQREDLDAVETARALSVLIDEYRATHEGLGRVIGKSQTYVTRTLNILKLPERVLAEYAQNRHVPTTMLAEIATLDREEDQIGLWERAKGGLSVAAARQAKQRPVERGAAADRLLKTLSKVGRELSAARGRGDPLDDTVREQLARIRSEIDALLQG